MLQSNIPLCRCLAIACEWLISISSNTCWAPEHAWIPPSICIDYSPPAYVIESWVHAGMDVQGRENGGWDGNLLGDSYTTTFILHTQTLWLTARNPWKIESLNMGQEVLGAAYHSKSLAYCLLHVPGPPYIDRAMKEYTSSVFHGPCYWELWLAEGHPNAAYEDFCRLHWIMTPNRPCLNTALVTTESTIAASTINPPPIEKYKWDEKHPFDDS